MLSSDKSRRPSLYPLSVTFQLPKIYPITDTRLTGISIPEQVERLIAGGATLVQVREKSMPSRQFYEAAAAAVAIGRSRGVLVLINDRVDIALAAGADGVHLGQDDLPPAEARKILGPKAIIGFSTHTVEQAVEAAQDAGRLPGDRADLSIPPPS